MRTVVTIFR